MATDEFSDFVSSHSADLYRLCLALTGSADGADDLLQESLLRCYTRWSRVRAAENSLAYARRVIVTQHVSLWRASRKRRLAQLVDHTELLALADASYSIDRTDTTLEILDAIRKLSRRQRAVVILTYLEDLPDLEIARLLTCGENTVKSHRAKALRALRCALTSETTRPKELT